MRGLQEDCCCLLLGYHEKACTQTGTSPFTLRKPLLSCHLLFRENVTSQPKVEMQTKQQKHCWTKRCQLPSAQLWKLSSKPPQLAQPSSQLLPLWANF